MSFMLYRTFKNGRTLASDFSQSLTL